MTQASVTKLLNVLRDRFGGEVETEEVAPGRFRFVMFSPYFEAMPNLKRQDEVWDVVDETLPPEESLDITLVLTYAPSDLIPSGKELL